MIVYAVNVHTGGGKVLLNELISNQPFGKVTALFHDSRYQPPKTQQQLKCISVKPTVISRLLAEKHLHNFQSEIHEPVLFFGNLPPFVKPEEKSILYLQSGLLLANTPARIGQLKIYLRIQVEKLLLKFFYRNIDEIWVQTNWMLTASQKNFQSIPVFKKPIFPTLPKVTKQNATYDLLSITGTPEYKNLSTLLEAILLLDKVLSKKINVAIVSDQEIDLKYKNLENVHLDIFLNQKREEVFELYQKSKISVITSEIESFCIPLYESLHFGLKVVALKAPYIEIESDQIHLYEKNSAQLLSELLAKMV